MIELRAPCRSTVVLGLGLVWHQKTQFSGAWQGKTQFYCNLGGTKNPPRSAEFKTTAHHTGRRCENTAHAGARAPTLDGNRVSLSPCSYSLTHNVAALPKHGHFAGKASLSCLHHPSSASESGSESSAGVRSFALTPFAVTAGRYQAMDSESRNPGD